MNLSLNTILAASGIIILFLVLFNSFNDTLPTENKLNIFSSDEVDVKGTTDESITDRTEINQEINKSGTKESTLPLLTEVSAQLSIKETEIKTTSSGKKYIVDPNEIQEGCSGMDCIPSIENPDFESAENASKWLEKDDFVLALNFFGEKRAYPLMILDLHEIVNDKIKGLPVVVSYCPLCGTGLAFYRVLNGKEVEFGVSGKLLNSDLVMYDRKTETYWSQISGKGIVGKLSGFKLKQIPIETVKWGNWKEQNPDTIVLSRNQGIYPESQCGYYPYGNYQSSGSIYFPVAAKDDRYPEKKITFGIGINEEFKAYFETDLKKMPVINDELGGKQILVVRNPLTESIKFFDREINGKVFKFSLTEEKLFDSEGNEWSFEGTGLTGEIKGKNLVQINSVRGFWFAWFAFHPRTNIFELP